MNAAELESFFFRPSPQSAAQRAGHRRESSDTFRPPPVLKEHAPYHLDLARVLPARTAAIQASGRLVFHTVGDTGGINGLGAQVNVADHMSRQIHETLPPDQPSFFYHLGDVVYYNGEDDDYHDQFYHPYQDYPAPIFAIPGNHDGNTRDPADTLRPFLEHFCSTQARHAKEAGHSDRPTMIQPNCYWRLEAPFVTVIGLYSNVSGELDNTDRGETEQQDWLIHELKTAPHDRCLIVAAHHPIYSLGKHGGITRVRDALEHAMQESGRMPDAVLTGHDHCYQRFTRKRQGWRIPVIVAGAGGFAGYDDLTPVKTSLEPLPDVKLETFNDKRPGFLRLTVSADRLEGEYFTVPRAGKEKKPAKRRDCFVLDLRTHRLV
jgi:hypothetical protein